MQDNVSIETTLAVEFRPHFLTVTDDGEFVNVVISHPSFLFQQMHERVSGVFKLIKKHHSDILKKKVVIVMPFSADEMEDLFEYWV